MFTRLIQFCVRYIGDIGAWHARSNYPREEHGIPVPIYGEALPNNSTEEGNVTLFRAQAEVRHG